MGAGSDAKIAPTSAKPQVKKCLPRSRGAVPQVSSPVASARRVFPAHAGLFPNGQATRSAQWSLPRSRGAVPNVLNSASVTPAVFPAHAGLFPCECESTPMSGVFPAHAGLFPPGPLSRARRACLPRSRGAVPGAHTPACPLNPSSPLTRGCSRDRPVLAELIEVFPAHAGLFPRRRGVPALHRRLPRSRGAVPASLRRARWACSSSPLTRGCSPDPDTDNLSRTVFPAHAGLFPRTEGRASLSTASSPLTRGCSQTMTDHAHTELVFPSHAGLFPRPSC